MKTSQQKKIRFADLTQEQQDQVENNGILDEIAESPEQEELNQKHEDFHREFNRALEALGEEKLTTGALFAVASMALDFAEQAVASMRDPDPFKYNPSVGEGRRFLQALLSAYLPEDSRFWQTLSDLSFATHKVRRLEAKRRDQAADEMFGPQSQPQDL